MPLSHDAANKISGSLTIRLVLFVFKIEDMQKFAAKKDIIFALLFVLKGQHIPENISRRERIKVIVVLREKKSI